MGRSMTPSSRPSAKIMSNESVRSDRNVSG